MIIIDMNQISLASLMMDLNMRKSNEVDEGMVRHMILNSIRLHRQQFQKEFGEVILTYDSKHYWRRDYFPNYKAGRKKGREKDNKDWDAIFNCLNKIKAEFKDNLPYKYLEVYGAEADDIIATLCKNITFFNEDDGRTMPRNFTEMLFKKGLLHEKQCFERYKSVYPPDKILDLTVDSENRPRTWTEWIERVGNPFEHENEYEPSVSTFTPIKLLWTLHLPSLSPCELTFDIKPDHASSQSIPTFDNKRRL